MGDAPAIGRVGRLVAIALAMAWVNAGCTSTGDAVTQETTTRSMPAGEERLLPEGDEPSVFGPLGETEAEFETDDGLVQVGSGDVPDAIADSFPIPDGVEVQLSSQTGTQAGFSGVTDMMFDELVNFYEIELPDAGYEALRSRLIEGVVAVYDFVGPDGSGQLAIASAPGGRNSVLVTFES